MFLNSNNQVHSERLAKEYKDSELKFLPSETVFPFVHGEQVE